MEAAGRQYTRTDYFLRAAECPTDYHDVMAACRSHDFPASTAAAKGMLPDAADPGLLPIGVTTYRLFNEAELASIETEAGEPPLRVDSMPTTWMLEGSMIIIMQPHLLQTTWMLEVAGACSPRRAFTTQSHVEAP